MIEITSQIGVHKCDNVIHTLQFADDNSDLVRFFLGQHLLRSCVSSHCFQLVKMHTSLLKVIFSTLSWCRASLQFEYLKQYTHTPSTIYFVGQDDVLPVCFLLFITIHIPDMTYVLEY